MFNFFKKSLANRLFISFIVIGFLPFVIFLIYTLVLSEKQIVQKLIGDQHHELEVMSKLIDTHLNSLKKETLFLARLEIMDDALVEDMDKRISRVLKQKKDDYDLDLDFYFVNDKQKIIASSSLNLLDKEFSYAKLLKQNNGDFIFNKTLYVYTNVKASFESTRSIGYLILSYNLDNLESFLVHVKDTKAYILNTKNSLHVGNTKILDIKIKASKDSIILLDYIVVYRQMDNMIKDWYIFYGVKKEIALEFFYNFILFMLYLSPFILALIILISYKSSKYIVSPILDLTKITEEIIHTKEYSRYLSMFSEDEVGKLASSFNALLNTTGKSIDASEAKSSFISNMSHELKTPLNAIIGFSQYLISYEKLTDEQLDIVANIESSSQYLLEMIHGILDIAKIEAGKVDLHVEEKECLALCMECFGMLEPLSKDKNLEFSVDATKCELKTFKTDEKIFKQILINLLSNAIKYTQKGRVTMILQSDNNQFLVSIVDSGIGIEKEQMGKLFKEFSRIDNELSNAQKGTGLGLSLSKKLAQVLDADIYLQSDGKNKGTKAVFALNLRNEA